VAEGRLKVPSHDQDVGRHAARAEENLITLTTLDICSLFTALNCNRQISKAVQCKLVGPWPIIAELEQNSDFRVQLQAWWGYFLMSQRYSARSVVIDWMALLGGPTFW